MGENHLALYLSIRKKSQAFKVNSDISVSDRLWRWYKCSYSWLQGNIKPFSEAKFFLVTLTQDSWFSSAVTHPISEEIPRTLLFPLMWVEFLIGFFVFFCWFVCFKSEIGSTEYSAIEDIVFYWEGICSATYYIHPLQYQIHPLLFVSLGEFVVSTWIQSESQKTYGPLSHFYRSPLSKWMMEDRWTRWFRNHWKLSFWLKMGNVLYVKMLMIGTNLDNPTSFFSDLDSYNFFF